MTEDPEDANVNAQDPIVAVLDVHVTIRGTGPAPTISAIESAIEEAVQSLGGVSRANRPLMSVKARGNRMDA